MTNVAASWLVVSDENAIKLGLVSADGESLVHTRTLDEIKAVAHYDRARRHQAEEMANEMGGAWVVDTDGDTHWMHGDALPEVAR